MTTGEKITHCRKKAGLTQNALAEMLGVSRQAVSRWESDLAFPETDKLLKMSKLFDCSVDYLLKYGEEEPCAQQTERVRPENNVFDKLKNWHFEYKSAKTVGGVPLVHVNIGFGRTAKGVFAVGIKAKGIFSVGLLSLGLISLGTLSCGLISIGALSLGILALGALGLGVFALGGAAIGIIAFGGVAVGLAAFGGCAVGGFSFGGYAYGQYIAIGDIARGGIALGASSANGKVCSYTVLEFAENRERIYGLFSDIPDVFSPFVNWCKDMFDKVLNGSIALGGIKL